MCSEWKVPEGDPTSGCNIEHWTLTGHPTLKGLNAQPKPD